MSVIQQSLCLWVFCDNNLIHGCFLKITTNMGVLWSFTKTILSLGVSWHQPSLWVFFFANYRVLRVFLGKVLSYIILSRYLPLSRVPPLLFCLQIRHCSSEAGLPTMLPDTVAALVAELHTSASWTSSFLFPTDQGYVDLSPAMGPEAMPLAHLPPNLPRWHLVSF